MAEQVTRRLSYFHPETGEWNDVRDGATMRIDAKSRSREVFDARNEFYRRGENGRWDPVHEDDLTAEERGLVWEVWPTSVGGDNFVAFRGVRVLDGRLAEELCQGITIRNEQGQVLESPLRAGLVFLLDREGMKLFSARLKDKGGRAFRGDPAPQGAKAAIARLEHVVGQLERERDVDAGQVEKVRGGDFSAVAAFHTRTKEFLEVFSAVPAEYQQCHRALSHLLSQDRTPGERTRTQELLREARSLRERAQVMREARDADASEIDLLYGEAQGKVRPGPAPAPRLVAFREIGRLAKSAGHEVENTSQGVRIKLEEKWLTLGPGFRFGDGE